MNLAEKIDFLFDDVNSIVSSSLRGFIKAPKGKRFIVCDFSAIEARVLAWLAGEIGTIKAFETHGKIYEHAASKIYDITMDMVSKDQRQVGKTAILAFGYQGGVGAFRQMEKTLGLDLEFTDEEIDEIKKQWRDGNPHIKNFWTKIEDAAVAAVQHPGNACKVRGVTFKKKGSFLLCRLPSGRCLKYAQPSLKVAQKFGQYQVELRFKAINSVTRKWERQSTYGGKLVENITQAVARDLLVEAMIRLEEAGYEVIFHVHDEAVCEVDIDFGSVEEVEEIMSQVPDWAKGCPIAAEGYEAKRYRK